MCFLRKHSLCNYYTHEEANTIYMYKCNMGNISSVLGRFSVLRNFSCYTEVVFHDEYFCFKAIFLEGISYSDDSLIIRAQGVLIKHWSNKAENNSLSYKNALKPVEGMGLALDTRTNHSDMKNISCFLSFYKSPCSETNHFRGSTCSASSQRHGECPQM